jgi:hypothetical protein
MNKIGLVIVTALSLAATLYLININTPKNQTPAFVDHPVETPAYDLWVHWKKRHQRTYRSTEEEARRLEIFHENYHFILNHMKNPDRKYDMGFNKFMDISREEFKQRNGLIPA